MKFYIVLGVLLAVGHAQVANGTVINDGAAYAIADNFVDHEGTAGAIGEGSHFHASNEQAVDPENSTVVAADVAEVGGFFQLEEIRGPVEFDLTGMALAESAKLSFDVADVLDRELNDASVGGLFGQAAYIGDIDVVAYLGNNAEDRADFQASPIGPVGSFNTDGLEAGETIEFDVTSIYNEQIEAGSDSLGIRLQISSSDTIPDDAISFDNFQLTVVPEPSTFVLALLALLVLFGSGHRRRFAS